MANVIPSAPPSEVETQSLYPVLQPDTQHTFRMGKVNEIASALAKEVVHYRLVRKKYKRTKTFVNWAAGVSGSLRGLASSAGLASALTGIGIPVAVPLGVVGGLFSVTSSGLIVAGKKHDKKMAKHQEIVTLALAKRETVTRLVSQAITDNKISDAEFQVILSEFSQYNEMKEKVCLKLTRNQSVGKLPDIEKIKREAREEAELAFQNN